MVRVALVFVALLGFDLKADLQKRYDLWTKAYMAFDVETLESLLAPDYVLIGVDKEKTTRENYVAYLKLRKELHQDTVKYSSRVTKVERKGNEAVVLDTETQESVVDKKRVLHRHEYRDTWVDLDGAWKLRRTETLRETTKVVGGEG